MLFTVLVILLALPFESTIRPIPNGSWEVSKLRFVAMGMILCITFSLALVAQFALRKPADSNRAMHSEEEHPGIPVGAAR